MAKYIDADKLIAHLNDDIEMIPEDEEKYPISYGCILGIKGAISLAKTLSTADVVEVVRCNDCKYATTITELICGTKTLFCEYNLKPILIEPTHFCSYGERKNTK